MNEWFSDFKAELYRLQLFLEKRSALHLFFLFFYAFITAIVAFHDFIAILSSLPKIVFPGLFVFFVSFLLVLDTIHVKIIKNNRIELDGRKFLINELISTQPPYYKVKYRHEFHEIENDGDSMYHRETTLLYDGVDIAWAEITYGSTNAYGTKYSEMIITARCYPEDGHSLARVSLQSDGPSMRYAIILRNKLSKENPSEGFQTSMKWKGVWTNLVKHKKDDGTIRVIHDTEEFVLELQFPHGYRCVDFRMPRTNGDLAIGQRGDGHSYISYKLTNLKKGEVYRYFVEVEEVS